MFACQPTLLACHPLFGVALMHFKCSSKRAAPQRCAVQVANPALEPRHWAQIYAIVEQPYEEGQPVRVDQLLEFGVADKLEAVQVRPLPLPSC